MLLASIHDDGSIWRRVHFNYLLYFNAKKKQTAIVVARNVANPIGAQEHVGMTHTSVARTLLLLLQLSINRDVLNADTTSRRYAWWFQVKNNTVVGCCNCPSNIPQTIIWISFLNRSESLQNAMKFERHIYTIYWDLMHTHFIVRTTATCYFKCMSPHRFDLIAKAVLDSFRPEKFYAINVICTWANTIPLAVSLTQIFSIKCVKLQFRLVFSHSLHTLRSCVLILISIESE